MLSVIAMHCSFKKLGIKVCISVITLQILYTVRIHVTYEDTELLPVHLLYVVSTFTQKPVCLSVSRQSVSSVCLSTFIQGSLQGSGFLPDHSKNNSLTRLLHHLQHFLIGHPMETDTV